MVYVYSSEVAKAVDVGDYVLIEGGKTAYNDVNQFAHNADAGAATVTKLDSKDLKDAHKFTAKEAELWDSERLDAYINKENATVEDLQGFHVTVQGQLSLSAKSSGKGYYYNIAFDGANTAKGSIAYPSAELAEQLKALDGKMITTTGYTLYKSGTVYVNIFAESVAELNLTEQEKANIAANSLKVSSSVSEDFTLKSTSTYGATVTWTSSNPAAIAIGEKTDAGYPATVTRSTEDVEVKLTATVTVGTSTAIKEFTVTVASLAARTWSTIEEVYEMTEGEVTVRGYYQGHNNKAFVGDDGAESWTSVFIASGNKWLQVYKGLASLYEGINVGDIVEVKGTIAHYSNNGGTTYEITPTTVTKITDTELLTAPEWLTVNETTTPEIGQDNVNQGAHISGAVVTSVSANKFGNLTINFTVGTKEYVLFLDSRYTDVTVDALANLKAGDTFSCDTFVGLKDTNGQFIYANNFTVTSTGTTEPENPTPDTPDTPDNTPTIAEKTIAEVNAYTAANATVIKVSGVVQNLYNTSYGNFFLVDPTTKDQALVYGLVSASSTAFTMTDAGNGTYNGELKNDQSFATTGVKEGDYITVNAVIGAYQNKPQLLCQLVSVETTWTSGDYDVTVEEYDTTRGTVTLSKTTAKYGEDVVISVAPANGYKAIVKTNHGYTDSYRGSAYTEITSETNEFTFKAKIINNVQVEFVPTTVAALETVVFDFSDMTGKGAEITSNALATFQAYLGDQKTLLKAVEVTKVFSGNGRGGAYENTPGLLKFGTSSVTGSLKLIFDESTTFTTVEIVCRSWSTSEGTNFTVNGTTKAAPKTDKGTLVFTIAESNEISISAAKRGFIFSIKLA